MQKKAFRIVVEITLILVAILILAGCNIPGTLPQNVDDIVAQTMTALSLQAITPTLEIPATPEPSGAEIATPMTPPENTVAPIVHAIMPGEMQAIESTVDDVLYNSDDFSRNMYERPFTQTTMENRFDLDLQKIAMSTDNTFFYFSLDLKDVNINTKTLDGNYGIEIDIDKDGRGDYLLWAYQPPTLTTWDIMGIALFSDVNKDVGGSLALTSDPANPNWNGYESEVWPSKPLIDPDGAWMRLSPNDATVVQLAVKRSLLGNPASFMWSAWTDDQIKATYKFDYNDFYTAAEAGSPVVGNSNYPLKALAQMDSTCREAWGFKPTGNEPGICKKAAVVQPTAKPKATTKPGVTPTITPLIPTKQVITVTQPPTCTDIQITGFMLGWNPSWTNDINICLSGYGCQHPDASGYVSWVVPAGSYTITASQDVYRVLPETVGYELGCGKKGYIEYSIDIP
jgi:hypothetical protein